MSDIFSTSVLYPIIVQDDMRVVVPQIVSGYIMRMTIDNVTVPVPAIQSASLVVVIAYLNYGPTIDNVTVPVPSIQNASLVVTINYIDYVNELSFLTDNIGVPVPTIQSASLA